MAEPVNPHAAPRIPRLPGTSPSHLKPHKVVNKRALSAFFGGSRAVNRGDRRHECKGIRWARHGETTAWITCICGSRFIRHGLAGSCNTALEARWNQHTGVMQR